MKIVLSLDYEVFFGSNTGTVEKALLDPTNALLRVADRFGFKFALFVDAGFLIRLHEQSAQFPALRVDLDAVRKQLETLHRQGHDLQLHIHPHWEDCHWDGTRWVVDTRRYRLHDFPPAQIEQIVSRYKAALTEFSGNEQVFAYRAGGWVIQPFERIREALRSNGIYVDSTVFSGGTADSATHFFDFRGAPDKSSWRFEADPLREQEDGYFLEVPIASRELSPLFFWKHSLLKRFGGDLHRSFGDGAAVPAGKNDLLSKLTRRAHHPVSIDGYKATFLHEAFHEHARKGSELFVVIGHSKLASRYGLDMLERFCSEVGQTQIVTYREFARPQVLPKASVLPSMSMSYRPSSSQSRVAANRARPGV